MEYLLEFGIDLVLELIFGVFDSGAEVILDQKKSKGVRILVLAVAGVCMLAFFGVVFLLIWTGSSILSESTLAGIILIGIGILFVLAGIWKVGSSYRKVRQKLQD